MLRIRRWLIVAVLIFTAYGVLSHILRRPLPEPNPPTFAPGFGSGRDGLPRLVWKDVKVRNPVSRLNSLPSGPLANIPRIQADFGPETSKERATREKRLAAVKAAIVHSWDGYRKKAWRRDEVTPISGLYSNGFGGWGATLVDSLDTLWIAGMHKEFEVAVAAVKDIDFTANELDSLNLFETTIRYLGGLLGAYDISGQVYEVLLEKAIELGEMLYVAFDTTNRMPVTRWNWKNAAIGGEQEAGMFSLLAEVGSMTLEFTRLSQLTGDAKWYDAVARITNRLHEQQNQTHVPGLWPVTVNAEFENFRKGNAYSIGGMADSMYEYLPKEYLMLGGRNKQYQQMYTDALEAAKTHIFFRPLDPSGKQMLIPGTMKRHASDRLELLPHGEHLGCFAGGMVALAAKIFQRPHELETSRQLVDGCLWTYEIMPTGIMPETFTAIPCNRDGHPDCSWSETKWHDAISKHLRDNDIMEHVSPEYLQLTIEDNGLQPGLIDIPDGRYNLRPEAIESIFVLYRITGDKSLLESAWKMFQAITRAARTKIAYASILDVTEKRPKLIDSMESFWLAETLKYFYLIFSEPDVVSLDEYVFNTEAHPLLRPR